MTEDIKTSLKRSDIRLKTHVLRLRLRTEIEYVTSNEQQGVTYTVHSFYSLNMLLGFLGKKGEN